MPDCPVHPEGCYATCDSCGGGGWVHIDFADGEPDGVYNCDCDFGQAQTHDFAMERHAEQCGCAEYGAPKSDDAEKENLMITSFKYVNHPSVLSASKIVIAEGCRAVRVVLRKIPKGSGKYQYTVHKETLGLEGNTWRHESFYEGHYHNDGTNDDAKSLDAAHKDWLERSAKL